MSVRLFVVIVLLPLVAVGYSTRTQYIEDHCTRIYLFSKDFVLAYSHSLFTIPAYYTCSMTIQNQDRFRQAQIRVLSLDTKPTKSCTTGAVVIAEPSRYLTPRDGICGSTPTLTKSYRTTGSQVTVTLTNRGSVNIKGNFRLLVTSVYNASNRTCHGDDFLCHNGLCVSGNLLCNGYNDCGDNSDEEEGCTLVAGAIAGIIIAVAFGIFIISVIVFIFERRRRRHTHVIREYPSLKQPVIGGNFSYHTM
ncbi:hypothetical protein ACOMHN_027144 [Nucella lapillus]